MRLPRWMYIQIISDPTAKTVWCHCGEPAISYCNGLQFICQNGDHFGVPMKALKPRDEQEFFEQRCAEARELERRKAESRRACKSFVEDAALYERGFCGCGYHESEHRQRQRKAA